MDSIATVNTKSEFLSNFIPQEFPDNPRLLKIQEEAALALQQLNFPTTRDEQWKYTRISKILRHRYTQTPPQRFSKSEKEEISFRKIEDAHLLVFINGFYSTELSQTGEEKGAIIQPLSLARKESLSLLEKYFGRIANHSTEIFTALNTVYHTNGAFVFIKENTILEKPVHIVNISASNNAAYNPRNLIILEKNSRANIIFSHEALRKDKACLVFNNTVTEAFLEEGSNLSVHLLQNESNAAFQVNTANLSMESNAKASFFTMTTGGNLVRNNLNISLEGSHCEAHLLGLYLGQGEQLIDNHTLVAHKKPDSYSNELYKGIMNGKSTGVFNGKVFVYKDAQKTNAYQSNQNMLLTDEASVDSKPELEIYANDVKCSHGSTTGQLDEEAVFYLRSRGISEKNAKHLLLRAFAKDVIEKINFGPVKEIATERLGEILNYTPGS